MSEIELFLIWSVWYASGMYLVYKAHVAFKLYLHKKYTIVTPIVESPKTDIMDVLFIALLGPLGGLVSWMVVSSYMKSANISFYSAWHAKVGRKYFS